jgi:alpha-tubulin suppressor-like RCC1 family protein
MAVEYVPSLTDLTHPTQLDDSALSQQEILLIKQYINNTVMPALVAGIQPPAASGFIYKGTYSGIVTYVTNNIISYGGAIYIALAATTGNTPPIGGSNSYWQLVIPANSSLTTEGDILYYSGGQNSRLPVGANGTKLASNGTDPNWVTDDASFGFLPAINTRSLVDFYNANTAVSSGLPAPVVGFPNPAAGPVLRPVARSYTNNYHAWLNRRHEVVIRGTGGSYNFGGTGGTGGLAGSIVLNNFSAANGVMAAGEYFVQIHCAFDNILALTNLGNVWAIGRNNLGQCGQGNTTEQKAWVQVASVGTNAVWGGLSSPIVALHVGMGSAIAGAQTNAPCCIFAIDTHGRLFGWGSNALGQLGIGTGVSPITSPTMSNLTLFNSNQIVQIHSSGVHSLAIDPAGNAFFTGYGGLNSTYGSPDGTPSSSYGTNKVYWAQFTINGNTAKQVLALADTGDAATHGYYANSFILTTSSGLNSGLVYGCGYNGDGRLGNSTTTSTNLMQVAASSQYYIKYIMAASEGQYCTMFAGFLYNATFTPNCLYSWGYNANGQCGNGTTTAATIPNPLTTSSANSFTTNANNGVVNTSIIYYTAQGNICMPVIATSGAGTHGAILYDGSYNWFIGNSSILNVTTTTAANANIANPTVVALPYIMLTQGIGITDYCYQGTINGSASGMAIQLSDGRQFGFGYNTNNQYNDSGSLLHQFAQIVQ